MINKIFLEGKELFLVIEYKNVKNINLRIKDNSTIHISCPYNVSYKVINDILNKNKKWIIENTKNKNIEINEDKLLYLGNYYNIKVISNNINKINILDKDITIYAKDITKPYVFNIIKEWYYREANKIILNEVLLISERLELFPSKVLIGNQKTLWGSCNSKKVIRLNWRLILMPKFVRDYIIIHELCHLVFMNHSSDFWKLVCNYSPEYKKSKLWLKNNGRKLMNID